MSISRKKRRIFIVGLLFTFLYTGIISHLAWIQVVATRSFSPHHVDLVERAVAQRREKLVLNSGRGMIYDRQGTPLTGEEKVGLAIFPLVRYDLEKSGKVDKLARILGMTETEAFQLIKERKHAGFWEDGSGSVVALRPEQAREIQALSIAGVLPLPVTARYPKDELAPHIIGYIGQNAKLIQEKYMDDVQSGALHPNSKIGVAGLERTFQPFLAGVGEKSVSYYVDGRGNPLNGLDIRMNEAQNSFYPLSVMTTLDRTIQQKVEEALQASPLRKGAAVILDVGTREVLASASKPNFDPSRPNPGTNDWQNLAIKQTTPGSIFKMVVAAAALEEGLVKLDDHFVCKGQYGKYGFTCWKEGGHGELTFAEAFADSCNITFAEVAKKVGPEKLELYARKLGLNQEIGWQKMPFYKLGLFRQFDGEERGRVFAQDRPVQDEGVLIQTGIGQRDVQLTPLQAANMAAIIAGGGQKQKVKIVQSINYQNGTTFYRFEDRPLDGGMISPETASKLRGLMEGVVDHGTATMLRNLPWKAAGKSGTAQITVNGVARNNQWFVGYVPRENPKYAIAILAADQPTKGVNEATKLFGEIVTRMAQTEKK
ncbi:peptidoglycan D,D-transpeptidase FtsI family protein [Aneurinibacillus uraniidurans]|uniref:peptidoglycan D,D-transpeptidase FtsI family protein n=1 Tax=Aneurinibacillus uraniidurans TaxID=2966586 RepID=UPI00234BF10B|nr:penicillin-binding transpeptidase domain-containing protein [Aneurinibacillus sp. B1]WCN38626.1 penicillin-binding transpeptidase domain-containing protein [Aneurinibacillus sp. B1]